MEVLLVTCAESAIVDTPSNRLSLFNLVEEIAGASFPGILPSVAFVIVLSRKKSEANRVPLKVTVALNSTILTEVPYTVAFQGKLRVRSILTLQGIPILEPGKLVFTAKGPSISANWQVNVNAVPKLQATPTPLQVASRSIVPKKLVLKKTGRKM
jgi:hypothetical protein